MARREVGCGGRCRVRGREGGRRRCRGGGWWVRRWVEWWEEMVGRGWWGIVVRGGVFCWRGRELTGA